MGPEMEDHLKRLPTEHGGFPAYTQEFLNELRPEEINAIRAFARLTEEEVRTVRAFASLGPVGTKQMLKTMELAKSIMTVGKFMRWVIIGFLAIFFTAVMFAEKIMQIISWVVHGPKI